MGFTEFMDNKGKLIDVPVVMEEVIMFIKDCEEEQKIHPDLADEIIALIAKDANLLVKEMTNEN